MNNSWFCYAGEIRMENGTIWKDVGEKSYGACEIGKWGMWKMESVYLSKDVSTAVYSERPFI